jgi:hypothetical protein
VLTNSLSCGISSGVILNSAWVDSNPISYCVNKELVSLISLGHECVCVCVRACVCACVCGQVASVKNLCIGIFSSWGFGGPVSPSTGPEEQFEVV